MKRMSSQRVLVEGRSLLGTRSRNRRVYPQQVMKEAGTVFQPYVTGIFTDQVKVWASEYMAKWDEEFKKRWKEEHINEIKEAGEDYDC